MRRRESPIEKNNQTVLKRMTATGAPTVAGPKAAANAVPRMYETHKATTGARADIPRITRGGLDRRP